MATKQGEYREGGGASVLTREAAGRAMERACADVGLDVAGARPLRLGSNAVYRLASPVVVRVGERGAFGQAVQTVAVARWLLSAGYPAVRALDVTQPVSVDGYSVTFWDAIPDGDAYGSTAEVARLLRRLHSLSAPGDLELPAHDPLGPIRHRLVDNVWLGDEDRQFLLSCLRKLSDTYAAVDFSLPGGVIHGDANVGNVLRGADGDPLLIDLDGFCVGHREWDLIQTAIFYDRFGWHTREEYDTFAKIYGFDIILWSGYENLRDIRELHMVAWLIHGASEDPVKAAEARKRLSSLRTGSPRRDWKPY